MDTIIYALIFVANVAIFGGLATIIYALIFFAHVAIFGALAWLLISTFLDE